MALILLCRSYWYPLYAFARRQGASSPDAQDLTQEFFVRLSDRFDQLLRSEIAHTVSRPTEIDEELRHLIEVLHD